MFAKEYHTINSRATARFTKLVVLVGLALLFLHLLSTAAFSQGIIKTLDYPGASYTAPEDINDHGVIVGFQYKKPDQISHGFLYMNGGFTPYDVQGASFGTQIRGINISGDFVGFYWDDQNQQHGFLHKHDGEFQILDFYGVNQTFPTGINDLGAITGVYVDNNQVGHYFVYANGQAVQVDIPNTTIATEGAWPKINNSGSIIGVVNDNNTGENRAALISNGSWTLFNVNGQWSRGRAVNASGAITGFYNGGESGFVLKNGSITLVQVPGALDTLALAINDRQEVVGAYDDANGTHGFLVQVP